MASNPRVVLDQMVQPEDAIIEEEAVKIYGEIDDTIPSSPTVKSISPPSSIQKLRRYINKMERSLESIKDILDEKSPGLQRRIKKINQGSLILADWVSYTVRALQGFATPQTVRIKKLQSARLKRAVHFI